jgi:hypothetical protein
LNNRHTIADRGVYKALELLLRWLYAGSYRLIQFFFLQPRNLLWYQFAVGTVIWTFGERQFKINLELLNDFRRNQVFISSQIDT